MKIFNEIILFFLISPLVPVRVKLSKIQLGLFRVKHNIPVILSRTIQLSLKRSETYKYVRYRANFIETINKRSCVVSFKRSRYDEQHINSKISQREKVGNRKAILIPSKTAGETTFRAL